MKRTPSTFYLIRKIERAVNSNLERVLRRFEITAAQYAAMSRLAGRPGISATELARINNVTQQTMNVLISGLESRDLVLRCTNTENRRELLLNLSTLGLKLLDACDRTIDQVENDFFAALAASQRLQLDELLRRLDHGLGAS